MRLFRVSEINFFAGYGSLECHWFIHARPGHRLNSQHTSLLCSYDICFYKSCIWARRKKWQKNWHLILGFFSTLISLRLRETLQVSFWHFIKIDDVFCFWCLFKFRYEKGLFKFRCGHNFRFWSNLFSMQRLSPTKEFHSFAKISLENFMSQFSSN